MAEICGRADDARLWSFLQALITEFHPHQASLDDEDTGVPISQLVRTDTPPLIPSASSPLMIPLERVPDHYADTSTDQVEDLLPTPSSSTISEEVPASRFMAFLPPDSRRIGQLHPNATQGNGFRTASSNQHHPRTPSLQVDGPSKARDRQGSSGSNTVEEDYPDPYGILPEERRSESGSHSRSRGNDRSEGAKLKPKVNEGARSRSPMNGHVTKLGGKVSGDRSGKDMAWEEYKAVRMGILISWWRACVDDVSWLFSEGTRRERIERKGN